MSFIKKYIVALALFVVGATATLLINTRNVQAGTVACELYRNNDGTGAWSLSIANYDFISRSNNQAELARVAHDLAAAGICSF